MNDYVERSPILEKLEQMQKSHPANGTEREMSVYDACAGIAAFVDLLPGTVAGSVWVSVEECPPEEETEVLVWEMNPNTGEYSREIRYYDPEMYMPYWQYVTHWMPLPEPPEKK